jgi:hypothetical protein
VAETPRKQTTSKMEDILIMSSTNPVRGRNVLESKISKQTLCSEVK